MIDATRLDSMLTVIAQQAVAASLRLLRDGKQTVPPAAFGVTEDPPGSGTPQLVLMPVLDLQQRFAQLKQGVEKAAAQGFVFLFDGVIKGTDGLHDALLVVTCTRDRRRAMAVQYRRDERGIRASEAVDAPDEIALPYQQVFDVQAQSRTA